MHTYCILSGYLIRKVETICNNLNFTLHNARNNRNIIISRLNTQNIEKHRVHVFQSIFN